MAVVTASFLMSAFTFADEAYIKTWDDYKASGAPAATWNDVADAMSAVLDAGKTAYEGGDADLAYKAVSDAYYGYYETTGFERVAMGYISGSRKSEMELQFAACKSVAKKGGSTDEFNEQVELLKSIAFEVVEAARGVVRLRTREDLEHHVLALVRMEELGNHGRVKGALGQKAVLVQVEQVCAARTDGVGDIRE